jgi:hypothetical protein
MSDASGAATDGRKTVAKYDQDSGQVSNRGYAEGALGGIPSKKDVDAIDRENTPKTNPKAVGK